MSQNQSLIAEMKNEAASTRKMLERVPTDKNDWKPHGKSMKLGNLANHIAELHSWATMIVNTDELNLAGMDYKPQIPTSAEELVAKLDNKVNEALEALEKTTDEDLNKIWTLRKGDHVIFALPKKVAMRSMVFSHMYHHRGQLSVYLRLLDVPVPGMYGPSYDDIPAPAEMSAA